MDKHLDNLSVLDDFVEINDLDKSKGWARFDALVTISTAKRQNVVEQCEVMINFEGYNNEGQISLLDTDKDPHAFPTVFKAKFNNFKLDGKSLLISDFHSSNPIIGNWEAIITPI